MSASVQLLAASLPRADAFETVDHGYYFAMAKSPSHALPARMRSCSRAKNPPPHLTGRPARTSHVASPASEVGHPMGGSVSSIGDVAERPLKERVKFITTSSSLRGPTSSISTTSLSCQHINDLSSIALGLQICGHPLSSGCPIPSRQAEGQHIASRQTAS